MERFLDLIGPDEVIYLVVVKFLSGFSPGFFSELLRSTIFMGKKHTTTCDSKQKHIPKHVELNQSRSNLGRGFKPKCKQKDKKTTS